MAYAFKLVSFEGDNFVQLLGVDNAGLVVGYHGSDPGMGGINPNIGETLLPPYTIANFTGLNYPNSIQTQVVAINNLGTEAGFYANSLLATAVQHGFIDQNGTFATFDATPGGVAQPITNLLGVNNSGTEVGFYQDAAGNQHAFTVTGGSITGVVNHVGALTGASFTALAVTNNGVAAAVNSTATGVNNLGTIVGFFTDTNNVSAGFVETLNRRTGLPNYTTVSVPGATITQILGINDAGVMVGDFTDAAGKMHGFVDNAGNFTTIDGPGATATTLNGINDFGEAAGFFTDANNNTIGMVGTPVGGTIALASLNLGTTGGLYMVQGTSNAVTGALTGSGPLTVMAAPGTTGPASAAFTTTANFYTGAVTIQGVTLDVAAAGAVGSGTVSFAPAVPGQLKIETAARPFTNVITNFVFGDVIDIEGFTTVSTTVTVAAGGILTLAGAPAIVLNFNTVSDPVGTVFSVAADGAGGSVISVPAPHQILLAPVNFTGDVFTQLLGINNAGTIVGYHGSGNTNHPNIGLLLTPPSTAANFTVLNDPLGVQTQDFGVNATGTIDGFYVDGAGVNHGFIDANGSFSTVDDAPAGVAQPINQLLGINNAGVAAGYYQDAAGDQHPYTVTGGVFTPISIANISPTVGGQATNINNAGIITGFFTDTGGVEHGFIDTAGVIVRVDVPTATATQVLGINDGGVMVGDFTDAAGATHGFIDDHGSFTTIDNGSGLATFLNGINDFDQVVGFAAPDATGTTDNGFILTPNGNAAAPVTIGAVQLGAGNGLYTVQGTRNTIAGAITGTGTLTLQPYANGVGPDSVTLTAANNAMSATSLGGVTLDLAAPGALSNKPIIFSPAGAVLRVEAAAGTLANVITTFNPSDVIDLAGVAATAMTATVTAAGTLSIPTATGGTTLIFNTIGTNTPAGTVFSLLSDNTGGTTVTLARNYSLGVRNDPSDLTFNQLLGITNAGTIVGYFGAGAVAGNTAHPNVGRMLVPPYGNNNFTTLNMTAQTQVFGLSTAGTAVGFFANITNTASAGFLENNGIFTAVADTPVAGVVVNQLLGENNLGTAAGFWQDPTATNGTFLTHGYIVSGGVITAGTLSSANFAQIAPTTSISSMDTGVNDSGEVVGFFTDNTPNAIQHGFTFLNSAYTIIDAPGAVATQILGVNNGGVVVGDFTDAGGVMHGFVDDHGAFTIIDGPNAQATTVNGINDFGEIVGFDVDATSGFTIGFIGTPSGSGGSVGQVSGIISMPGGSGVDYLQGSNNIIAAALTTNAPFTLQLAPGATAARVTFTGTASAAGGITVGAGITADLAAAGAAVAARGNVAIANKGVLVVETADAGFNSPITVFSLGATIDLRGVATSATQAVVAAGGTLSIPLNGGGTRALSFPNSVGQTVRFVADGAGGTNVLACFLAGTRLLTPRGEIAVEHLREGDAVLAFATGRPATRKIRWIGHTTIDLDRHPNPIHAAPVRIKAGAFTVGMPHADLLLSPDHAVRVIDDQGAALVPIHLLVNGRTIRRDPPRGVVTYFHVELDVHGCVLANGLPAETYLDTGNRADFANAGPIRQLHPTFGPSSWDARADLILLLGGARVRAARERFNGPPEESTRFFLKKVGTSFIR